PPLEAAPTSTACSLNSRSWAQWTAPPPIATDTHRDALAPIERHAHGLQAKICCSCSWLHFLKGWSLLKTRCDSLPGSNSYLRVDLLASWLLRWLINWPAPSGHS